MSDTKKTPAQIHVDALNRKRKPLIKFDDKPIEQLKKDHFFEIEELSRQLRQMQQSLTHKEAYIQELEDKLAKATNPPAPQPVQQTEEVPGTSRRRSRQKVEPETTPPPQAGDGITEDDDE